MLFVPLSLAVVVPLELVEPLPSLELLPVEAGLDAGVPLRVCG